MNLQTVQYSRSEKNTDFFQWKQFFNTKHYYKLEKSRVPKSVWLVVISLTLIFCIVGHADEAETKKGSGNLVKNGAFDAGLKFWRTNSNDKCGTFKVFDNSLNITRTKTWSFLRAYQDISVKADWRYCLRYRAKSDNGARASAWINFREKGGVWKKGEDNIVYLKETDSVSWKASMRNFSTGKNIDKIRINLGINGKHTGTASFDDIVISALPETFNICVPKLGADIAIDGKLEDSAWLNAVKLDDFRILGFPSKKAYPKTEVLLGIYGENLLIAYRLLEPGMNKILMSKVETTNLHNDDCVQTFIGSNSDNYFQFIVNPKGIKRVNCFTPKGKFAQNWYSEEKKEFPGAWYAAAHQTNNGWSVEMKIPLKSLLIGSEAQKKKCLYMNFARHRNQGTVKYSNWARLTGKSLLAPGQFVRVKLASIPNVARNSQGVISQEPCPLRFTKQLKAPEWPFVGKPISIVWGAGKIALPSNLKFIERGLSIDSGVKELVEKGVCVKAQSKMVLNVTSSLGLVESGQLSGLSLHEQNLLKSEEAFKLSISKSGISIIGNSKNGVLRGFATIALLGSAAKSKSETALPNMTVYDAPRLSFRGMIFGPANPKALEWQIDIAYLLRMNAVFPIVFAYMGKTPFPFDSHLDIGDNRSTKTEWSKLSKYAKARGIKLIPFHHAWTKAGYILSNPRYQHLAVSPVLGAKPYAKNFCVSNPDSEKLVNDLLGELADTIKPPGILIGQDEIHFSDMNTHPLDVKRGLTRWQYVLETSQKAHDFLKGKNVTMYMWADMLDPYQNGNCLELSGSKLLEKFPRDIVMMYWEYHSSPYKFLKIMIDSGFPVIGCSWFRLDNVSSLIKTVYENKGLGYCCTVWNTTYPKELSPNLAAAISLGAYLSWSPENCNLERFPFLPTELYRQAAFRYGCELPYASKSLQIKAPIKCSEGKQLVKDLGFPANCELNFLKKVAFTNYRGVYIKSFQKAGKPVGIVVKPKGKTISLPLSGKAKYLTLLHCVNKQDVRMSLNTAKSNVYNKNKTPGYYVLHYKDGTEARLKLRFRYHVNDWNDEVPATFTDPGLFGVVNNHLQVNIPTYTWINPHPNKELSCIELVPGNLEEVNLILLGISVD